MSNITSNKILAHMDRIMGNQRPITADIFINNFCNNKCPFCTYRRWEFDNGAESMSYKTFVAVAERLKELGVKGFILSGGGEPTINKDFDCITLYLDSHNYSYGINTNFNVLKYFKPEYLKVSLDGWDRESYMKVRGVDMYDTVRANIIEYAEWKKDYSPKTSLGIQMIAETTDAVYKFYEANKDLPVDYIVIRPMESTNGSYYKNLPDMENMKPRNIIWAIKCLHGMDERVVLNYKWNLLDQQEEYCIASWAQIAVNERAEVMYCCHKPYEIIGSVFDDDILEKKAHAVTNMKMCDIPCRMTAPNMEVKRILSAQSVTNADFI